MARLNFADRKVLAKMYAKEASAWEIARELGVTPGTIYDELKRGYTGELDVNSRPAYDPNLAQKTLQMHLRRCGNRRRG